jgi:uncharacterized protein (DUF427 family)
MSLTMGRGPLSPHRAGWFNPPLPDDIVYVEPHPRRVRARLGDAWVVDSEGVLLVHRAGAPTSWVFPPADVRGVATVPEPAAPDHVAVPWNAVDAWYEEEQEIIGHPRSLYHRIDILPTRRRLRVEGHGVVLVDTDETTALYETSLAARLYVPRDAVRMDLLVPSSTTSYCPYKGTATYWTALIEGDRVVDAAWTYEDPLPESLPIKGMLSFYEHRLTVTHDLPT